MRYFSSHFPLPKTTTASRQPSNDPSSPRSRYRLSSHYAGEGQGSCPGGAQPAGDGQVIRHNRRLRGGEAGPGDLQDRSVQEEPQPSVEFRVVQI